MGYLISVACTTGRQVHWAKGVLVIRIYQSAIRNHVNIAENKYLESPVFRNGESYIFKLSDIELAVIRRLFDNENMERSTGSQKSS